VSLASAESRRLGNALAQASDTALGRVVGMLEAMGSPAEADVLLAGIRPRLRVLRPPRPLRLNRLLFMPMEGALVDAAAWTRGSGRLPRSALLAIAEQLRGAAPEEWRALEASTEGRSLNDGAAVGAIGRRLWALAARAMPEAPPPGWKEATGLRPEDHGVLVRKCIGIWREASPLWDAVEAAPDALPEPLLRAAMAPFANDEALFSACLATLMQHAAAPWVVADEAGRLGAIPRRVADRALDDVIETVAPRIDAQTPGETARMIDEACDVWLGVEASTPAGRGERRRRAQQLRHEADRACRTAYSAALEARLLQPMASFAQAVGDAEVAALESTARQIRAMGLAGRRLGSAASYDEADRGLPAALARLIPQCAPDALTRVDIARLVEIICGPEVAAPILNGA
jgi:hypothetical protein